MKARSPCLTKFVDEIDEILSKLYSRTAKGEPLQPLHDDWGNARDRLMAIKMGNLREPYYPINWQLAEHLILSELAVRIPGCVDHAEQYKAKMKGPN